MTPSLLGRIQTRLFLTILIGAPIGFYFKSLNLLLIMLTLGIGWDCVYNFLQKKRWDGDWPPILMAMGGMLEWIFPWGIIILLIPSLSKKLILMYWSIWILTFIFQLGPLNVMFPRRRFKSGRIFF